MTSWHRWAAGFSLALALFAVGHAPAAAEKNERETFMATVLQTANMRLPGGGTFQITMNVDEWTSVEERKRLLGIFKEGGSEALMKELRKMKAGYIVPPAFSRWPSWEVDVASSIPQPDGGRSGEGSSPVRRIRSRRRAAARTLHGRCAGRCRSAAR